MGFLASAPTLDQPARLTLPAVAGPAVTTDGEVPAFRLLIDGEWRPATGGASFDVVSPIDGTVIATAAKAGEEDVLAAIAAAKRARTTFRQLPAAGRLEICAEAAQVLGQHLDAFAGVITVDLGKTPEQAGTEVKATRERLLLAREEVRKIFGEYLPGDWIADTKGCLLYTSPSPRDS